MYRCVCATLLILAAVILSAQLLPAQTRPTTDRETHLVVRAIEDEIYDYSYEQEIEHLVGKSGGEHRTFVTVYISPEMNGDTGSVVYKLMPHGEVYRGFYIAKDGVAVLLGDPENGFPATEGSSRLTIFLDDNTVCRWKREWQKHLFEVDNPPSPQRLRETINRQKQRFGFSIRENPTPRNKRKLREPPV